MNSRFLYFFVAIYLMPLFVQAQNKFWKRYLIGASFSGADGVRLADVNNNNLMEIATGWEEAGYTKVYLYPGYKIGKRKIAISDCSSKRKIESRGNSFLHSSCNKT